MQSGKTRERRSRKNDAPDGNAHTVQPGARLLLVDFRTDPSHTQPAAATLLAGEFLVIAGEGDVYSAEEVRGWLGACGWRPLDQRP
jgi:hypothetical protein